MTRFALAAAASLVSSAALAQPIDCSAFELQKDGSWLVTRAVRVAGTKDGVSTSAGLAAGDRFDAHEKPSMGGVDVFAMLEAHCR